VRVPTHAPEQGEASAATIGYFDARWRWSAARLAARLRACEATRCGGATGFSPDSGMQAPT